MSQWDAFKKSAQGMASAVATRAAAEASKVAAGASKLTTQAVSQASNVAQRAMSSNPALQMIGQEITIGGKQLYIESLLAEGESRVLSWHELLSVIKCLHRRVRCCLSHNDGHTWKG